MTQLPDHPDIASAQRTGYPWWMLPKNERSYDDRNSDDDDTEVDYE